MQIPRKITVLVDSREKRPLLFPKTIAYYPDRTMTGVVRIQLEKKVRTLAAADYLLERWPTVSGIERKANTRELTQNLFSQDYARFSRSLDKLVAAVKHPYLLLEGSLSDLSRHNPYAGEPDLVFDSLARITAERGIQLLLIGRCGGVRARTFAGAYIVRLMLAHAMQAMRPSVAEMATRPSDP